MSQPGDGTTVARAVVNTPKSCGSGGVVVLLIIKMLPGGKWSIIQLINGCLAGMSKIPGVFLMNCQLTLLFITLPPPLGMYLYLVFV